MEPVVHNLLQTMKAYQVEVTEIERLEKIISNFLLSFLQEKKCITIIILG